MNDIDTAGTRLRKAREAKGVTLREAARGAKINASQLSRFERGQVCGWPTVAAICDFLGVSMDWLRDGCIDHEWVTITRCENCGERQ